MTPRLSYQKLLAHIDGSAVPPSATIVPDNKTSPNPEYETQFEKEQWVVIILNSSLSEEAASEVMGLSSSVQIWDALKNAYS